MLFILWFRNIIMYSIICLCCGSKKGSLIWFWFSFPNKFCVFWPKKTPVSFNWVFVCKGSFASLTGVFFFSSPDFSSSLLSFLVWFRGFSFFGCKNLHFSPNLQILCFPTDFDVIYYSLYFNTDFLLFRTFQTCCRFEGVDSMFTFVFLKNLQIVFCKSFLSCSTSEGSSEERST